MSEKITLKETVIVEGRYDRQRLSQFIESPVIETSGFRVFKDAEKQRLIRAAAEKNGVVIMTDSDAAGFVIRNFLKSFIPQEKIKNCYIPEVPGKEKRKSEPSKEGKLGVEGLDAEMLLSAIIRCGATVLSLSPGGTASADGTTSADETIPVDDTAPADDTASTVGTAPADNVSSKKAASAGERRPITKSDLFDLGLSGRDSARERRTAVLRSLDFPVYLSTNAFLDAMNALFTLEEFEDYLKMTFEKDC